MKLVVAGAGIIGLSIGWRMAKAGWQVTVFDRTQAGRGASWAAAGMLAACAETEPGQEAGYELGRRSQELWPGLVDDLETETGISVGYRCEGTLLTAKTSEEVMQLRQTYEFQKSFSADVVWCSGEDARQLEPTLSDTVRAAIFCPKDGQVSARRVVEALRLAFVNAGGDLVEDRAVHQR